MKANKKILTLIIFAMVLTLAFSACGKADEGPDDKPISIEPAGNVIAQYTFDDVDHSKEDLKDTAVVRLHYRRNDDTNNDRSSYVAWNVWAWDMTNGGNGDAYQFTGYDDYGVYADLDLSVISGGISMD